jgi:hypothetical protein
MKSEGSIPPDDRRKLGRTVRVVALVVAGFALFFGLLATMFRDEVVARFEIGNGRSVVLTAEPVIHYEPPGYIRCILMQGGKTVIPRRGIVGVGPERVPNGQFAAPTNRAGNLVAITLDGNIVFLYDFESGQTWPDEYSTINAEKAAFARKAIGILASEGLKFSCHGLATYERNLRIASKPKSR